MIDGCGGNKQENAGDIEHTSWRIRKSERNLKEHKETRTQEHELDKKKDE